MGLAHLKEGVVTTESLSEEAKREGARLAGSLEALEKHMSEMKHLYEETLIQKQLQAEDIEGDLEGKVHSLNNKLHNSLEMYN